jgi:hypothetical protein
MTDALDRQFDHQPAAPARPFRMPPPRRPAAGVAAAVLGFEAAALYLVAALLTVLLVAAQGLPAGGGAQVRLLGCTLGLCLLAGLLLAGGVAVLRGTGRALLLVATAIETALLGVAALAAAMTWPAADELPGVPAVPDLGHALSVGAVLLFGVVVAVLVLRLVLAAVPSLGRWLGAERAARRLPGRSGRRADRGRGVLVAVLLPVVAVAVVAVVAVVTAPTSTPSAPGGAAAYRGSSEWGATLYQGGAPLAPPAAGDPLYSAPADADARSCYLGDMGACDSLFESSPVDDVYEWYGSSCAGRLDHESEGGCVAELGAVVD